ncbi:hypothetical protein [Aestuariibaculum sediminum]|uniref:Outer membrane protein beta-barrel domain-containing protein n=1 Tax=Aestuariibaculum sediminum TaxID=2770637 RepID=A0A8J6Q6Y8_9FLAO|nr:hypothetical protein [Aestuariibaculum sediminum]MBD0831245.1 hypothetical protein [Aestuariibaculum sediminum]
MNFKPFFLLVAIVLCFVTKSFSQHRNYQITNGFSIFGAMTQFDIATDNFTTSKEWGFLGGMWATVDIPHRWYNVSFGMQLSESNIGVSSRPEIISNEQEFVEYKMFAAQIALLGHIKLGTPHVTLDFGPMLQYNSDLELKDKAYEDYYVNNYNLLQAADITSITRFNINGVAGITAGYKYVKLRAQYLYGATNMLKKLNSKNLNTDGGKSTFKGHQNMLVLGLNVSF